MLIWKSRRQQLESLAEPIDAHASLRKGNDKLKEEDCSCVNKVDQSTLNVEQMLLNGMTKFHLTFSIIQDCNFNELSCHLGQAINVYFDLKVPGDQ